MMAAMKWNLSTGETIDLASVEDIDKAMDQTEKDLIKLRRLRRATAEMTGAPDRPKKEKKKKGDATANGTTKKKGSAATTPAIEAAK